LNRPPRPAVSPENRTSQKLDHNFFLARFH
jgi:hypothetical protein